MKRLTILISFSLCVCELFAQHVTEEQAFQKAQAFMQGKINKSAMGQKRTPAKVPMMRHVALTIPTDAYYIFNAEESSGFVIVSGDERTEAILGYSTEGNINAQNMPENMKAWLKGYEAQIKALPADFMPAKLPTHPAVEPLLSCHWNQGAPYNLQCPEKNGRHCVTGCVATAIAQIMYYWKWPQDSGIIPAYDYDCYWDEDTQSVICNHAPELPSVKFDWFNMIDHYNGSETDASADAVAQLMRYCGQSVEMDYDLSESGANEVNVYFGLKKKLSYDEGIRLVYTLEYTINDWDNLIYGELYEKRPVYFQGYNFTSAHAFVCDGYDGAGMYHINWGWGEQFDGFFCLSILNPYHNSYNDRYSFSMANSCAIIGIQPPTGNIVERPLFEGNIVSSYNIEDYIEASFKYNGSEAMYMDFAIGVLSESGAITNVSLLYDNIKVTERYNQQTDFSYGALLTPDEMGLSDGTYCFVPLYKQHFETEWIISNKQERIISGGKVLPNLKEKHPKMEIMGIQYGYLNSSQAYIDVTLKNLGEEQWIQSFYEVSLADHPTYSMDELKRWPGWTDIQIEKDGTSTVRLVFTPNETGIYNFWIVAPSGTMIVQGFVNFNPGDVNGDGKVDMVDVTMIINEILGISQ